MKRISYVFKLVASLLPPWRFKKNRRSIFKTSQESSNSSSSIGTFKDTWIIDQPWRNTSEAKQEALKLLLIQPQILLKKLPKISASPTSDDGQWEITASYQATHRIQLGYTRKEALDQDAPPTA